MQYLEYIIKTFNNASTISVLAIAMCSLTAYHVGKHVAVYSECTQCTKSIKKVRFLESLNIAQQQDIVTMDSDCETRYKELHTSICNERIAIVKQQLKACREVSK
jgi:hypothetical protein